jgi:selenide,water dikinase
VGILSASLKKEQLSPAAYQQMIHTTTQLNTPGIALSAIEGVHAITDVTGFGLAGHALEMARGSHADVHIQWSQIPLIDGVMEMVSQGFVTGASARNWSGYGGEVVLPHNFSKEQMALITDPQTSGGLLVSCSEQSAKEVLTIFKKHGFDQASVVGCVQAPRGDKPSLTIL